MSYSAFHTLRGDRYDAMLLDTDGSELYETEYEELLGEMVKANDEWMVRQYIKKHPKAGLYPSESSDWDVFFIACEHGSLDALRVLLDYYHAHINSPDTESLEQRGISLMGIAGRFAQLDTVHFLLDSQPPLGTVEPGDGWCETALLSAATSFSEVGLDWERCQFPERSWVRDRMARSEGLDSPPPGEGRFRSRCHIVPVG